MSDYTEEQLELMAKVTLHIYPAFNNEYVIETETQDGEFQGRFNATDLETLLGAIRAAYTDGHDDNNNIGFDIN